MSINIGIFYAGDGMLAWYLVISFILFLAIDYKVIYNFLDSKILYTSSGSKINYDKKEVKSIFYIIENLNIVDLIILVVLSLISFLLLFGISSYIFSITPLYLNLGYKSINIHIAFAGVIEELKLIYNLSQFLFCIIFIFRFKNQIINFIKKQLISILNKDTDEPSRQILEDKSYNVGRDENDECISILEKSLYQNVLITGSIGSGKTSGAISRLTYSLIKSGKSGLILDVKGNFAHTIEEMCKRCGRYADLKIISKNSDTYFNILNPSSSCLELANRVKQILELLSVKNNSDSYWLDKVQNFLTNIFIIMKYLNKFNILELHKLITEENYLKQTIGCIKEKVIKNPPNDKLAFELSNAVNFISKEFDGLDTRVKSIIKSEITRFTTPLITEYDIYNQFCNKGNKEEVYFNDKNIIVLSIPTGENRTISKIMAIILKLEFQKYVLSNLSNPIPIFFIADEFQEFANVADSEFLSLSREAKCINIISTQSYSSLKSTLKDEQGTNVIIQNLVNKIWFRTDDNYTVSEIIKQLGKTNVIRENKSISEAGTESKKYIFKEGFRNTKSSISKTLNYVETKENEYDENFFTRELKTFEALALLVGKEGIEEPKKIIFERWK